MVISLQKLLDFATVLKQYTTASITEVSFTASQSVSDMEGSEEGSFDAGGQLLFHGESTQTKKFKIPSPIQGIFEEVQNEGIRIKQEVGQAMADAYGVCVGDTFEFIRGKYY